MTSQWIIHAPPGDCSIASEEWGVPRIVAQILLNRGLTSGDPCAAFLSPQLSNLHKPEELPGAVDAAEILVRAIHDNKKIVIYGDYDVDGTTAVAILWHVLKLAGANVTFYVPHRIEEGYGLNQEAAQRLVEEGADVIVTVDCGITAIDVAEQISRTGTQLIITDHHTRQDQLPAASAIVHPTVGAGYPNPDICGAGVAFKLAWATAKAVCGADRVSTEYRELLSELLPLAALGTIADVVSLRGENRVIAKHGLASLPKSRIPGIRALIEASGIGGSQVTGYDVGFKLAPRINAAGRMGHARLAVELFTQADEGRASEIALYLNDHNRSRQSTERKISKQAAEIVDRLDLASDAKRGVVVASDDWHPGVIGIVASRLVSRYHRPAVMIALQGDTGQGSARSVQNFNLVAAFEQCQEHLVSYGGHTMAAGLRVKRDKVDAFTEAFVATANNRLTGADLVPKLRLDGEVELEELTLPTAEAIAGLGPFGAGNPKPKLATGWIDLAGEPRGVGRNNDHLQAAFSHKGVRLKGIGFGLASHIEDLKQHRRCKVAFEPIINEFNGRRSVELQMLDLQFPD